MKNHAKYLSYREAWDRINAAIKLEFYFEAITLCESIISDRLLSYVHGEIPAEKVHVRTSLQKLITSWRKHAGTALLNEQGCDLGKQLDAWREDRNHVVHGLVKSHPGTPTKDVADFISLAKKTAVTGKRLAREISAWHRKQLQAKKVRTAIIREG
jgi:hypothetical protein